MIQDKYITRCRVIPGKKVDLKRFGTGWAQDEELKAAGKEKALDTGLNIAARHIKQLKDEKICDGVHIMAIGMEDKVPVIMERAGLL